MILIINMWLDNSGDSATSRWLSGVKFKKRWNSLRYASGLDEGIPER